MKSNDWKSIEDDMPENFQSVLVWDGASITIAHHQPGCVNNEFVSDYTYDFVYAGWWMTLPEIPMEDNA